MQDLERLKNEDCQVVIVGKSKPVQFKIIHHILLEKCLENAYVLVFGEHNPDSNDDVQQMIPLQGFTEQDWPRIEIADFAYLQQDTDEVHTSEIKLAAVCHLAIEEKLKMEHDLVVLIFTDLSQYKVDDGLLALIEDLLSKAREEEIMVITCVDDFEFLALNPLARLFHMHSDCCVKAKEMKALMTERV